MMFDPKKILVLAPHPDDGELGCGGTIARLCSEKKEVHYVAFSFCKKSLPAGSGDRVLEKECKAAVSILGMDPGNVTVYDFEVREFPARRQELLEILVSLNKDIQPDLIFIPSATDMHQDHQVVHQEALRAFKHVSVLGYELPWNQHHSHTALFIKLSAENIDRKVKAVKEYKSQAHRRYMEEDFLLSLAKVRGVQCNAAFAESFEVCRWII